MAIEIRKIAIRNFKNLKDVVIYPKKFNVLIGPNGSGKTNFLEFFKLLRKIYVERNPYPFLEWDGYENVVWNHQRSLPIEFEIETAKKMSLAEFIKRFAGEIKLEKDLEINVFCRISASFWADRSENLKILKESIEINVPKLNYRFAIEKRGDTWKTQLNEKEYEMTGIELLFGFVDSVIMDARYIFDTLLAMLPKDALNKFKERLREYILLKDESENNTLMQISEEIYNILPQTVYLPSLFLKIIVLFSLNLIEIKYKRKIIPRDEPLNERGENALDILALTQLKENRLPERIEYAMENYFNGRVYFRNMNFYFYDLNKKTEYSKEHLPDGLLKLLVILTALEQNPSILLIDEIENSLHPELLEFLINTLKEDSDGHVFITTHSPVVLNLVDPEEIYIFKPKDDGSIEIKNATEYKSKEELMKELEELGISLGEKILYGLT